MANRNYRTKGKYNYDIVSEEQISESKKIREEVIRNFGFIPESILPFNHHKRNKSLDNYIQDELGQNSYELKDSYQNKEQFISLDDNEFHKLYGGSNWRGISQFNPMVAEFIYKLYSQEGDLVFDSCSGRLCRGLVAHLLKRHYYGYDVSKLFYEQNIKRLSEEEKEKSNRLLPMEYDKYEIKIWNKDSRNVHLQDSSVDFCFTSPPYYNIEYYGDEPEQLGKDCNYPTFLERMKKIINEQFRILKCSNEKRNHYSVCVVNDFRLKGNLIPYHADIIKLYQDIGFFMHDISVYKVGDMTKIFAEIIVKNQIVAKTMEHILVFKK